MPSNRSCITANTTATTTSRRHHHRCCSATTTAGSTRCGGGVAALLGVGALAAALAGSADAADMPELVLRRYVQVTLADHDGTAAAALTCRTPQLDVIGRCERDLASRARRLNLPPLHIDVNAYTDSRNGRRITASTKITVSMVVDGRRWSTPAATNPGVHLRSRPGEWMEVLRRCRGGWVGGLTAASGARLRLRDVCGTATQVPGEPLGARPARTQ